MKVIENNIHRSKDLLELLLTQVSSLHKFPHNLHWVNFSHLRLLLDFHALIKSYNLCHAEPTDCFWPHFKYSYRWFFNGKFVRWSAFMKLLVVLKSLSVQWAEHSVALMAETSFCRIKAKTWSSTSINHYLYNWWKVLTVRNSSEILPQFPCSLILPR